MNLSIAIVSTAALFMVIVVFVLFPFMASLGQSIFPLFIMLAVGFAGIALFLVLMAKRGSE